MRPNLFIAGFQKCGSSTLFDYLTSHPHVEGSEPKETYFFTDSDYDNYKSEYNINSTPEKIAELFPVSSVTAKYRIEATVANFYQSTAFQYAKANSDLKVIFIVRDPIERFISVYNYFGSNGLFLPPGTSIMEYFHMIRECRVQNHLLRYGVEHGRYVKYLEMWKNALGGHRVYVTSIKRLQNNTISELNSIYSFLGLELIKTQSSVFKNRTSRVLFPFLHRFLVKTVGNSFFSTKWTKRLYGKLFYTNKKLTIDDNIREELLSEYSAEYLELSQYF